MPQLMSSVFVMIKDKEFCEKYSFNPNFSYPVLAIDVFDNEDGNGRSNITEFLICNQKGEFHWINTDFVRRYRKPNAR